MDIVWIIVLVLLIYFAIVVSISAIRALLTKNFAKEAFKETFWDFFFELINPFNWF